MLRFPGSDTLRMREEFGDRMDSSFALNGPPRTNRRRMSSVRFCGVPGRFPVDWPFGTPPSFRASEYLLTIPTSRLRDSLSSSCATRFYSERGVSLEAPPFTMATPAAVGIETGLPARASSPANLRTGTQFDPAALPNRDASQFPARGIHFDQHLREFPGARKFRGILRPKFPC